MISKCAQSLLLSLALGASSACGGGGAPPGGGEAVTPITERPLRPRYQCRVDRGLTETAPQLWSPWPVMTTTAAGTTYLARVESTMTDPFIPAPGDVTVSTFTAAGVLGPPARLASLPAVGGTVYLDVAPRTDGAAVVWADTGTDTLTFASTDGAGQTVTAARSIPIDTGDRRLGNVKLAAGSDGGFALIYQLVTLNGVREVLVAMLSAEGALLGTPRVLATGSSSFSDVPLQIVAAPGGYAMLWVAPNAVRGRIDFSKVDLAGVETVAPRAISVTDREGIFVGSGIWSAGISLLPDGDGFLAAWPEQDRGNINNNTGASTVARLVRLAADGARLGTPAALRAPVLDVDEIEPSLVKFHDSVAVLWNRGSHIYACGGCVPDHRIDLMLIDPVDLVPVSEVVTLNPLMAPGTTLSIGLLQKSVAAQGSSILTAFNITFHTSHRSASASFACE